MREFKNLAVQISTRINECKARTYVAVEPTTHQDHAGHRVAAAAVGNVALHQLDAERPSGPFASGLREVDTDCYRQSESSGRRPGLPATLTAASKGLLKVV